VVNDTAREGVFIPPCSIKIEVETLKMLLPARHKKEEPVDLDFLLKEGDKVGLRSVFQRLTGLLRLEHTDQGPRYSLLGTFSSPVHESRPWPGSELTASDWRDGEEKMGSAVREEEEEEEPAAETDSTVWDWGRESEGGDCLTFDEEMRLKKQAAVLETNSLQKSREASTTPAEAEDGIDGDILERDRYVDTNAYQVDEE
jgi:hypothetical protein